MGNEKNKDLIRGHIAAVNAGDFPWWDTNMREDMVIHAGLGTELTSRQAYQGTVREWKKAFEKTSVDIEALYEDENHVILRFYEQGGPQRASYHGIPSKGLSYSKLGLSIYRIQDGQIAEMWALDDMTGQLIQLGALPPLELVFE